MNRVALTAAALSLLACAGADLPEQIADSRIDGSEAADASARSDVLVRPDAEALACPQSADGAGRACGPDPVCATSCGGCAEGLACASGRCGCVGVCRPDQQCGQDGCGGSCGACASGLICGLDGRCTLRPPDCDPVANCGGRTCGDDGCGGVCGPCDAPNVCSGGQCVCAPACAPGQECGLDPLCGTVCGTCTADATCTADGRCVPNPPPPPPTDPPPPPPTDPPPPPPTDPPPVCDHDANCAGRPCGDDGCGGQCGECGPGADCAAGRCCPTVWRAPSSLARSGAVAVDPSTGNIVAVGRSADGPVIQTHDACDGAIIASGALALDPIGPESMPHGVHLSGNVAYVVGDSQRAAESTSVGFLAAVSLPDLRTLWAIPLGDPNVRNELWDITQGGAGGTLYTTGVVRPFEEFGRVLWSLLFSPTGETCEWGVFQPGFGRAVRARDGQVWYAGGSDQGLVGFTYPDNCQPFFGQCECPPTSSTVIPSPWGLYAEARGIAVFAGRGYMAGYMLQPEGSAGVVASFGPNTEGAITLMWDPTPRLDGFLTATSANDQLFLGATYDWDAVSYDTGRAALAVALDPPQQLLYTRELGVGVARGIATQGTGVYTIVARERDATLVKCTTLGQCP